MSQDQQKQLLAWAAAEIHAAQVDQIFGSVTIYFDNGHIKRCERKQHKHPPTTDKKVIKPHNSTCPDI